MIFTIGYASLAINDFLRLLSANKIDVVCDVRSSPFSRYSPEYSQRELKKNLNEGAGIKYAFFGDELGARPKRRDVYDGNRADYALISKSDFFQSGIKRLVSGSKDHNIALLCAEKDPIECHRSILVCRELNQYSSNIYHLHQDGTIESQKDLGVRLAETLKMSPPPLLESDEAWTASIERALDEQALRIAYTEATSSSGAAA